MFSAHCRERPGRTETPEHLLPGGHGQTLWQDTAAGGGLPDLTWPCLPGKRSPPLWLAGPSSVSEWHHFTLLRAHTPSALYRPRGKGEGPTGKVERLRLWA